MSSGIPSSPEAREGHKDDLPGLILGGAAELSMLDRPELVRRPLDQSVVFKRALDADAKYAAVSEVEKAAANALFDIRLSSVAPRPSAPRTLFWQNEEQAVQTTLIRCSETLSLALEVSVDQDGVPVSAMHTLWHGDERAVDNFLNEHPITIPREKESSHMSEGVEELEDMYISRVKDAIDTLPSPDSANSIVRLLTAVALLSEAQLVLSSITLKIPQVSDMEYETDNKGVSGQYVRETSPTMRPRPSKGKRADVSRLPSDRLASEMSREIAKQQRIRIKQPRPQSGAKRGKRSSF